METRLPTDKMFRRGQIVRIARTDPGDDPRWVGLRCWVADIPPYQTPVVVNLKHIRLFPIEDRPDGSDTVDPRGEFFWPAIDLEIVEESEEM